MTLRTVLLSLQALLAAAEPDDPQDAVVAQQYKEHYEIFRRTALHWTSTFANGNLLLSWVQKLRDPHPTPLVGAQGDLWLLMSKPAVGQNTPWWEPRVIKGSLFLSLL